MDQISMLDCIRRIPFLAQKRIENCTATFAPLFSRFGERLLSIDEIVFVGSGTSYTSALTAKFFAERVSKIRVTAVSSNEFFHELTVRNHKALYIFLSQTGTSKLTNDSLLFIKNNGLMAAAVSESADTRLAQAADVFIDMGCGFEEYPMRTIGYSLSVLTLMLLAMELGRRKGVLSSADYDGLLCQACTAARSLPSVIDRAVLWADRAAQRILASDCLIFTGAGALYGVALEGSVKIWETPKIISAGYEIEEGMHGPNFGYNHHHCVVVLNDGGPASEKAVSMCKFMKFEHQNGYMIGQETVDESDLPFKIEGGEFACLQFAAALQVLAYCLAQAQGRDLYAPHDNSAMEKYFKTHR